MTKEFTQQEAMEFFQKMWNPLGLAFPGMSPPGAPAQGAAGAANTGASAMPQGMPPFMPFPPNMMNPFTNFDPEEVQKKINEFKSVETWLNMQIGFLQMTIKTMEMQKASLEALRTQTQNMTKAAEKR